MGEPIIRDVYFWSHETGLLSFPGAAFSANACQTKASGSGVYDPDARLPSLAEAEPMATLPLGACPDKGIMRKAMGAFGLLWTTSAKRPDTIPHMIPARFVTFRASRRVTDHGREVWDVEARWNSVGPFVADGFTRPALVEQEATA